MKIRVVIGFILLLTTISYKAEAREVSDLKFFIKTTTNSLSVYVTDVGNQISPELSIRILAAKDGKLLWKGQPKSIMADGQTKFHVDGLQPELWSPEKPFLYELNMTVLENGKEIKTVSYHIGFRDFESKNGQIFLNGHPLFLRGIAINPPGRGIPSELETSRAFAEEYVRFMKSINVNIIRIPDDQTWYSVCDELGMMVFGGNYSSEVNGQSPPRDYDKAVDWYKKTKFDPIMHHPSLVIYALTNEVPFSGEIAKKWVLFLDYAFDKLKKWDDTRLYIGNSGYGYGQSGDICDLHRYWGWYYSSPFTFLNIRDYERITFPDKVQPLTFTECVGNYTGPDGRYNLTPNHKNPVSQLNWTGHAPQSEQALMADQHQCYVFKQATELMRRLRRINPESSGVFPFTILFRNWHTVRTFSDMDPKPVTWQARLSYQPVLLSWEYWQPQVYAGATIKPFAHVINDSNDFSDLKNVKLIVHLLDKAYTQRTVDTLNLPDIPYCGIHSEKIEIRLPENLFEGTYQLEGIVLASDREVSRNFTEIFVGRKNSPELPATATIKLYDPNGSTAEAFRKNQTPFQLVTSFSTEELTDGLVIGENAADRQLEQQSVAIQNLVEKGARLIIMRQDSLHQPFLKQILPVKVTFPKMNIDDPSYPPPDRPSRNSFNINPERPDHPVFTGISRDQLRLWSDYTNWNETLPGFPAIYPVTDGFVLADKTDVGKTAILANYSVGLEGIALAEIFHGKGSILLSGFDLARRVGFDPVSDRLLRNMLGYMTNQQLHQNHVLVNTPILWGEYDTEKGIVTGIYSGLILNSKPALFGSYEKLPLILHKDGYLFAGKDGGWNTTAGKEYVPYGRRMFGPYFHRGFGGVPEPMDKQSSTGEGVFWCCVPIGTQMMTTVVWNPSDEKLPVTIKINETTVSDVSVPPHAYNVIESVISGKTTDLKILLRGDRRLVVLQTMFR